MARRALVSLMFAVLSVTSLRVQAKSEPITGAPALSRLRASGRLAIALRTGYQSSRTFRELVDGLEKLRS
jgi:hypothetical protein